MSDKKRNPDFNSRNLGFLLVWLLGFPKLGQIALVFNNQFEHSSTISALFKRQVNKKSGMRLQKFADFKNKAQDIFLLCRQFKLCEDRRQF